MRKPFQTLFMMIFLMILFLAGPVMSKDIDEKEKMIAKVENNLLPFVLIKDEPGFNLWERMKYYKVPGISIVVIKNYKIDWIKHYGVTDAETRQPVTGDTLFNIGSLSKGVASLGILRLVREGKIDLDKDVNKQLTSWKIPENEFTAKAKTTPRLLMNHSGGVMFSPPFSYLPGNMPTLLQLLKGEKPARSKPVIIDRVPGSGFQYSNAGFSILQQLAIDVEKKPFEDILRDKVFKPLDMKDSSFCQPLPKDLLARAAAGHDAAGRTLTVKRYVYPIMAAGGLWTTAPDYAKYVIELQKSFHGKSNKIIDTELTRQMLSPQAAKNYGMGVFLRDEFGERYFSHAGDNRGFFGGFASHLSDGNGAVILTNAQNGYSLLKEILNGIARVYAWKGYLPVEHVTVKCDDALLDAYPGRYKTGSDNVLEIMREGKALFINQAGKPRLFHVGDGKFVIKSRKGFVKFEKSGQGSAVRVIVYLSDNIGRLPAEPKTGTRMGNEEKVPIECLIEGDTEGAVKLYREIKKNNPGDVNVSENRFNRLGYDFLNREKMSTAAAVFELNVEFYPDSANVYDSLGEAYMKAGKKELAIKNYEKSLRLDPDNGNAKGMIKKLKEK